MLKALGVPWIARKVLASCTVSKVITLERREAGDHRWCEMTTTSLITKAQELFLDGREQVETNPLDNSQVVLATRADERGRVITQQTYTATGNAQVITRTLESGGSVYHVELVFTRGKGGGGAIRVHNYFNRIG